MSIETIQNFLTLPELPDIISYLILIVIFIKLMPQALFREGI